MLYLGWPATPLYLLDQRPQDDARLHSIGWGQLPIEEMTPSYIAARNIRYYAYDHVAADYFNSPDRMLAHLKQDFALKSVAVFCGPNHPAPRDEAECASSFIVLYRLTPKSASGAP